MPRNEVILWIVILVSILVVFAQIFSTETFNEASPALPCKRGYWCPMAAGGAKAYPCPGGTYGSTERLTFPMCSGKCDPGCVCNEASITSCPEPCPAGYYCVSGTGGNTPPIICPPGYYCPAKTDTPKVCPAGIFCAAGTTSI